MSAHSKAILSNNYKHRPPRLPLIFFKEQEYKKYSF